MTEATKYNIFTVSNLPYLLKAFWLYGPGVFTVTLSYYMLTNLSQGQDVLMLVGESKASAFLATLAVCFWALVMWYSSRLIGYEKLFEDERWAKMVLSIFPRLLAYNAFLSVEVAILALPTVYNLTLWWLLGFVIVQNAYSFLLYYLFRDVETRTKSRIAITIILAVAYLIFVFYTLGDAPSYHEQLLPFVVAMLFLLRVGSLWWFVYRRAKIDAAEKGKQYSDSPEYLRLFRLSLIRIPAWFLKHEIKTFRVFHAVAGVGLLLFIIQIVSIHFAISCGPLVIVLLSFCLLTGGLNIITAISIRLRFNLFILLLFCAWVKGKNHDLYPVQLTTRQRHYNFNNRPSLATYFKQWVEHRKEKITYNNYPVFVVLADGGASRSGYWVASVLNEWQNLYPQGQALTDHLFCLSGASGGSVGNAAYYAQLQTNTTGAEPFLANDFLSSCLTRLLGSDPARHIIPLPVTDRADAIAATMQELSKATLNGAFAKNWEEVIDTTGRLPLLLINTTSVQGGKPAVISTVPLKSFSARLDVLQSLDSTSSFSLATASILGARFPYVSPAGSIGKNQFVDGGYFDNSGAGVVHEMLYHLDSLRNADTTLDTVFRRLRFHVVHITNNPPPGKHPELISPLANDLAAPLLTVFNTYAAQTEVNDARLKNFLKGKDSAYTIINLYDSTSGDYPMNWVISSYRLELMKKEVQRVKENELKTLLNLNLNP